MHRLTNARVLGLLAILLVSPAGALELKAQAPRRRALLVGVDDYQSPRLGRLQGAVNDAHLVSHVLRTRFGFDDVRLLLNEQATRAGIVGALERLVADAALDDVVWIHFSGHGAQVVDHNGDEDDGLDETLIPQDGRTGDVLDLVDDELDVLLGRLRTPHVVVVFDSCHSGTATRHGSPSIARRSGPRDERADAYRRNPALRARVESVERPIVFFSATMPDEEALDASIDGVAHGLFTRALAHALTHSKPEASAQHVLCSAAQELRRLVAMVRRHTGRQLRATTPTLEAAPDRHHGPLFPSQAVSRPIARVPWVPVDVRSGAVMLRGGVALGAADGSRWDVYSPGETEFAPGGAVAAGTVTECRRRDAVLELTGGSRLAPELQGHRAILTAPPPASTTASVRLQGDTGACERLRAALRARLPRLQLAGEHQSADFLVDAQPGFNTLYAPTGNVIAERARPELIADVVSRSLLAGALLRLDNPNSSLRLEARAAKQAPVEAVGTRGVKVKATSANASRYRFWREGEPYSHDNCLQLEVVAAQACYLTVVSVDAHGQVCLLFPFWTLDPESGEWSFQGKRGFYDDGLVPAAQRVLVPDANAEPNAAGFVFPYGAPAGDDTIRVFGTTELATAELVRGAVKRIQAAQARGLGAEDAQRGLRELGDTLAGVATRGFTIGKTADRRTPAGEWAAASVSVRVEER